MYSDLKNSVALKNNDGSHWCRHFHEPGKWKEQVSQTELFGQAVVITNIKKYVTATTPCFR